MERGHFYTRYTNTVLPFPPSPPLDSRWVPVKRGAVPYGILVVRDTRPGEAMEYATATSDSTGAAGTGAAAAQNTPAPAQPAATQEEEPAPPAPFGAILLSVFLSLRFSLFLSLETIEQHTLSLACVHCLLLYCCVNVSPTRSCCCIAPRW